MSTGSLNPLVPDSHYIVSLLTMHPIRSQPMINWRIFFISCIPETNGFTNHRQDHLPYSVHLCSVGVLRSKHLDGKFMSVFPAFAQEEQKQEPKPAGVGLQRHLWQRGHLRVEHGVHRVVQQPQPQASLRPVVSSAGGRRGRGGGRRRRRLGRRRRGQEQAQQDFERRLAAVDDQEPRLAQAEHQHAVQPAAVGNRRRAFVGYVCYSISKTCIVIAYTLSGVPFGQLSCPVKICKGTACLAVF